MHMPAGHKGVGMGRGERSVKSECPLRARGGPYRGFEPSEPRCAPPRVWAADPEPALASLPPPHSVSIYLPHPIQF